MRRGVTGGAGVNVERLLEEERAAFYAEVAGGSTRKRAHEIAVRLGRPGVQCEHGIYTFLRKGLSFDVSRPAVGVMACDQGNDGGRP